MTEEEIDDLKRAHKTAGDMLARYAELAEKHGAPPGDSAYKFIAQKLGWQAQRAGKPEGYTPDRDNHHGDGSVRGISNGKG